MQDWDRAAAAFDEQPDHGLRDPAVLRAWTEFLRTYIPERRAAFLDVGCGTGSLSIVLSGLGHDVTGVDLSPPIISQAKAKAAAGGNKIEFQVMDAAHPHLAPMQFDAIVCRHVLWALPDTAQVLGRWADLLKARGCLVIIEGLCRLGRAAGGGGGWAGVDVAAAAVMSRPITVCATGRCREPGQNFSGRAFPKR